MISARTLKYIIDLSIYKISRVKTVCEWKSCQNNSEKTIDIISLDLSIFFPLGKTLIYTLEMYMIAILWNNYTDYRACFMYSCNNSDIMSIWLSFKKQHVHSNVLFLLQKVKWQWPPHEYVNWNHIMMVFKEFFWELREGCVKSGTIYKYSVLWKQNFQFSSIRTK